MSADDEEPVVSCDLQGGTVSVFDDEVRIERESASIFEDKTIPLAELTDVRYSAGIMTGHIQFVQEGIEPDEPGLFGKPVDENTLYFSRTKRGEASRLRDAVLDRI